MCATTIPRRHASKKERISESLCVNKVKYDSSSHWQVITQRHGSIWPFVLPYCVGNVINTCIVVYLKHNGIIDFTFSDRGHTFMSMMVSFLMVTRSNIAYSRYMEARQDLSLVMSACSELVAHATVFSRRDKSKGAQEWRLELAMSTVKLLRTVVSVLEYNTTDNHAWKNTALNPIEKNVLKATVKQSNERSPLVLAMFLRTTIASNVDKLQEALHPNKELKLFAQASKILDAYHGLLKLVTTPFPFPLVQMTRTFLFIWIFTLPWVLEKDVNKLPALLFTVFFITFAFLGLEFVAIELDDPFGDDDIDFDLKGLASMTESDIYINIFDAHGDKASKELLNFMIDANTKAEDLKRETRQKADQKTLSKLSPTKHTRMNSQLAWQHCVPTPTNQVEANIEESSRSVWMESAHQELEIQTKPYAQINPNHEQFQQLSSTMPMSRISSREKSQNASYESQSLDQLNSNAVLNKDSNKDSYGSMV